MSTKKYIKSTFKSDRPALVYEIERGEWRETFRKPENYFAHATRTTWVSTTGFNTFVLYKGLWYMTERIGGHGTITTLSFVEITAEEAAAEEMKRASKYMEEAQTEEAAAVNAAIEYDAESAKRHAKDAEFAADFAESAAKLATEYAAEAGTAEACSTADVANEYAHIARREANRARETAEQAEAEAAQPAPQIDDAQPYYIVVINAEGLDTEEERYQTEAERDEAGRYFSSDGYDYMGSDGNVDYYREPAPVDVRHLQMDADATAEAREAWTGEGLYRIGWSDGGTYSAAIWYETPEDLAADIRSACEEATTTHLAYAEPVA